MTKICKVCKEEKQKDNFTKRTTGSKDGYRHVCKSCDNARKMLWSKNNPEAKHAAAHRYLDSVKHTEVYKEKNKAKNKKAREEKYEYFLAQAAKRRAIKLQASPNWDDELTQFVIEEAQSLRQLRNKHTGISWHVDHIVPLQGKLFCGLHVWNNFQVIPATINQQKFNRTCDEYTWKDFFKE